MNPRQLLTAAGGVLLAAKGMPLIGDACPPYLPDIRSVPVDLTTPPVTIGSPHPGQTEGQTLPKLPPFITTSICPRIGRSTEDIQFLSSTPATGLTQGPVETFPVEMWMDVTTKERQVAPKMVSIKPISHIESAVIIVNLRYQGRSCAISSDKGDIFDKLRRIFR